ncbi:MAG: glycosyltransferase [Proteobacteria bacterium]|nr:glycosyltransferase [Pseudomonadota bacterium]
MVMPVLILFLFYHLALLLWLIWGAWQLSQLPSEIPGTPSTTLPSLTIVVPARNEENTISLGLTSLSSLSYPRLSIIVVNDRSEDATGKHIADFEKQDPRIRCEVVKQLPSDWLGKNHALQLGAESSESELILFTDADVEIDDDFLKRAVTFFSLFFFCL